MADHKSLSEKIAACKLLSLSEFIGREVKLDKAGRGEFKGLCPFHSERTPSFTVSDAKGFFHCHGCGAHGDLIDYAVETRGLTLPEACDMLLGIGPDAKPLALPKRSLDHVDIYEGIEPLPWPDVVEQSIRAGVDIRVYNPRRADAGKSPYVNYRPTRVFPYRDAEGEIFAAVLRLEIDGKKLTPCVVYARLPDGTDSLVVMRPKGTVPLYGLDRLAAMSKARVILAEGEKCADVAQSISPKAPCIAWLGGTANADKVDLEPLRGRKVIAFCDNDEPGVKAMSTILARAKGIADEMFVCRMNVDGKPKGWDIADAIEEGWDLPRLQAWAKEQRTKAEQPPEVPIVQPVEAVDTFADGSPIPEAPADAIDQGLPEYQQIRPRAVDTHPFRFLGYDHGVFYFLSRVRGKQIVAAKASELSSEMLLYQLADGEWWLETFGAEKKGINVKQIANYLMTRSYAKGLYDPRRLRGRGCWMDGEDIVFHAGSKLIVNGECREIVDYGSDYLYDLRESIDIDDVPPASNADAAKLLEAFELLPMHHAFRSRLLAGWCVIAPICGVLDWRPHGWLTGAASTGKTWVFEHMIQPLSGETAIKVSASTTGAGIRQTLNSDALPIIFDEAEGNNERSSSRIQAVLDLARMSSSGSSPIVMGSQSGKAISYEVRSCFLFASIGIAATERADTSRVTIFELYRRADQAPFERLKELERQYFGNIDYCRSIRNRTRKLAPVIRKNAATFASAIRGQVSDSRTGLQIGAMLAGAFSLTSTRVIDEAFASEWAGKQDWTDFRPVESETDEVMATSIIMDAHIRVDDKDGPAITRTVGELITQALTDVSYSNRDGARNTLLRYGIRVDEAQGDAQEHTVSISSRHARIKPWFSTTPWANKWKDQLARIDGAEVVSSMRFGPGSMPQPAVRLPWSVLRDS